MLVFNQTSPGARTAIIYITLGALLLVWCGVWWYYLHNNPPQTDKPYYWLVGSVGTGLTLLIIGFGLGRIGREAKKADAPAAKVPGQGTAAVVPTAVPVNGVPMTTAVPTAPVAAAPAPVTYPVPPPPPAKEA
jgi:hypothetical protein